MYMWVYLYIWFIHICSCIKRRVQIGSVDQFLMKDASRATWWTAPPFTAQNRPTSFKHAIGFFWSCITIGTWKYNGFSKGALKKTKALGMFKKMHRYDCCTLPPFSRAHCNGQWWVVSRLFWLFQVAKSSYIGRWMEESWRPKRSRVFARFLCQILVLVSFFGGYSNYIYICVLFGFWVNMMGRFYKDWGGLIEDSSVYQ